MKLSKEQSRSLGGLLLHGSINCLLAAATGGATPMLTGVPSIIAALANSITGNLASNHMATLSNLSYEKILDRISEPNPYNVNHDLERLFKGAAVLSLEFIKPLFLRDIVKEERIESLPPKDRKKFLDDLTLFFDENISDLRMVTKDDKTFIDKSLLKDPSSFLSNIVEQIFRMTSVEFDSVTEKQIWDFYASKLPYCFELAFKEALKNDDHGFKAFQIWILEEMRDQNTLILENTNNIVKAIENISQSQNLLTRDQLTGVLDTHTRHIYNHLQTLFGDITAQLEKVTHEINQNYERLYKLSREHYDVSRQNQELIKQIIGLLQVILEKLTARQSRPFPHELNLIPRHTDEFIGRETELVTLKQQLSDSSKVVLVNGIGGIGKTTLAKNFVANNANGYDHIAWVEVKQNDEQAGSQNWKEIFIGAFAYDKTLWHDGLRLQMDEKATLPERFNSIIHAMKNLPGKNLLVIDNAGEEIRQFNKVLPSPPQWHVLVTSRNLLNGFTPFHLDKLEKPKAIQLFKTWYEADEEDIITLLEEIEYHTLMIEMLAKTLSASRGRLTISYITEQLKTGHLDDAKLQRKIELSHTPEETNLFRHLLLTFRFSQLDEREQSVLKSFYFLLPQYYTLEGIFYLLGVEEAEKDKTVDYLDELTEKGWLNREGNSYSIHRLIQQAVLYQLNPTTKDAGRLINCFIGLTYIDAYTDKSQVFQYIPYVDYLINKLMGGTDINEYIASLLNNLGNLYSDIQQYEKAKESYLQALYIYRKLAEQNPAAFEPDIATTLNNLGILYSNIQQYEKAEATYLEVLQIRRRLAEQNPAAFEPTMAATLNNLSVLYNNIQQYEKAKESYLQALDIYRKLAEQNPATFEPNVAATLNNLGNLYRNIQQYKKAEESYIEALQIRRRLAEQNPAAFKPDVATTLNNLGNLYTNIQQYEKAGESYVEALDIYRKLAEQNPAAFEPNVATTLNNLGVLYSDIQQYEKTEESYIEALQIRRRLAEQNPAAFEPNVATTLNNLGTLYSDIQQYEKTEAAYLEALQIRRRLAKQNPAAFEPDVATTLNNLGNLYTSIRQYEKAEESYLEALDIYRELAEQNLAALEPDLAMTLNNLGILYSDIQQYDKAENSYLEVLQIRAKLLRTQPFLWNKVVRLHLNLADIYIKLNNQESSIENTKWGLVVLVLYCPSQKDANSFIYWGNEIITNYGLDFNKFWHEEVIAEVNKIKNR